MTETYIQYGNKLFKPTWDYILDRFFLLQKNIDERHKNKKNSHWGILMWLLLENCGVLMPKLMVSSFS